MKLKLFTAVIFLGIMATQGFAQNEDHDSLLTALKSARRDTLKFRICHDLFYATIYSEPELAKTYSEEAFELAAKMQLSDDNAVANYGQRATAISYAYLALYNKMTGNLDISLHQVKKSLLLHKKLGDTGRAGGNLNSIALIYFERGEYGKARKVYMEALGCFEADSFNDGIAAIYLNIGES